MSGSLAIPDIVFNSAILMKTVRETGGDIIRLGLIVLPSNRSILAFTS